MNTLEKFEKDQLENLKANKNFPKFNPGDTVKVHLKVKEGEKERIQIYEGVCIAKKNAGINSSFTVRKISYGEGIERVLPLYSPQIEKIELVKSGDVRRSKLYYLRGRSGKSARIAEKNTYNQTTSEKSDNKKTEDTKSVTSEKKTANSDEVKTKAADDVEKKE
mgnify:FL=1|jgi:large subunit ribosomal protein L19